MMGPWAQKPLQPVSTTLISSARLRLLSSSTRAFFMAMLPEAWQPVPPQTSKCERKTFMDSVPPLEKFYSREWVFVSLANDLGPLRKHEGRLDLSFQDVALEHLPHLHFIHLLVLDGLLAEQLDGDEGLAAAQPHAARRGDFDIRHAGLLDDAHEGVEHLAGTRGDAAGSHVDGHLGPLPGLAQGRLGVDLFLDFLEIFDLQFRHLAYLISRLGAEGEG